MIKTFKVLVVSLFLSLGISAQWDYHAHFWGSATLSFGLHLKLGKQERVKMPVMVLSLGLIKETSDLLTKGYWSWMDVRADATGCVTGFIVSDMIKRYKTSKQLKEKYNL